MVLPLNLAMTPAEVANTAELPSKIAWMACHFSPFTEGISGLPEQLPEGAMLMLDDRQSCSGHSPDLVTQQLLDAVDRLQCESVLLDFQRPWDPEADAMVSAITAALPCPVAVTEAFAQNRNCAVFLAPCPLHIPLSKYLQPWNDREIWLEATLCHEKITVTKTGTTFTPVYNIEPVDGGFYHEKLCCRYQSTVSDDRITFALFDTPESMESKLDTMNALGVCRAVGLWQEFGTFLYGKQHERHSIAH